MNGAGQITIVAEGSRTSALNDLWKRVLGVWPHGAAPRMRVISPQEALADPGVLSDSVVVIACDAQTSPAPVYKLVDRLEEGLAPALLLMDGANPRFEALAGPGVITAEVSTHPAALAGMAHALAQRQAAVDSLASELRVARRYHGGLRDEIGRMHEELQLAASVQRELLPAELPEAPGLEFGVLFRPCGYVSGDIYNVVRLDEHRVGFFVADAVGHGVPAALMTVVLSRGLPMVDATEHGTRIVPPAEAMSRLNEALLRGPNPGRRFATAVYGVIDSAKRSVTLAGAGHPPPLRIRPDGKAEAIETGGSLLGVFPDGEFDEATFPLEPDDVLLTFSDGFETAFPAEGAESGKTRASTRYVDHFHELVEARRSAGIRAAMERLAQRLDEASGSLHQIDDLTALVVAGADPGSCSG